MKLMQWRGKSLEWCSDATLPCTVVASSTIHRGARMVSISLLAWRSQSHGLPKQNVATARLKGRITSKPRSEYWSPATWAGAAARAKACVTSLTGTNAQKITLTYQDCSIEPVSRTGLSHQQADQCTKNPDRQQRYKQLGGIRALQPTVE